MKNAKNVCFAPQCPMKMAKNKYAQQTVKLEIGKEFLFTSKVKRLLRVY